MQDEMVTVVPVTPRFGMGTLDHRSGALQMRAIDWAMRVYFGADDWLAERDKHILVMRRVGAQPKSDWILQDG